MKGERIHRRFRSNESKIIGGRERRKKSKVKLRNWWGMIWF